MKLNSVHVMNFLRQSSRVDKQGYMSKRGFLNTGFKRRWFVLKGAVVELLFDLICCFAYEWAANLTSAMFL